MGAHGYLPAKFDDKLRLLKHHLVDVAPAPVFSRLEGLDNRVVGRVEMLRRVLVLRGVAASDMPANQALAQVNPAIASFQTVLTAIRARRDLSYLIQMTTLYCHVFLPFIALVLSAVLEPRTRRTGECQQVI
jgi:hypothetical protein